MREIVKAKCSDKVEREQKVVKNISQSQNKRTIEKVKDNLINEDKQIGQREREGLKETEKQKKRDR